MIGPGGRRGGPRGPMIAEKPKDFKKTVARLLGYLGKSKILLIIMILCVIASAAVTLIAPTMQTAALDYLTLDSMGGKMTTADGKLIIDFEAMAKILAVLAVLFAASSLFSYLQSRLAAKLSQGTVKVMRADLFRKIEKLSIGYTDNHPHGDLMSRMTNDIENVSNTISQSVTSLISSVITIIGALCIMLYYSWEMTLISMITIPLTLLATSFLTKRVRRYFLAQQRLLGELNAEVEESVMGYRTILAFSREEKTKEQFSKTSAELKKTGIKAEIFGGIMGPLMNIIGNIGYLLIVIAGVVFAINGRFSVTTVFLFIQFSKQFTRPLSEIANQYTSILNAVTGAERVFEIMDEPSEIDAGTTTLTPDMVTGRLSFRHINFSYVPGEPVLKDFCLEVNPGQKIAIVGKTGSGKTTIINLLTRFYETDSGEILIDGINIKDVTKDSLRKNIAIVLQDTVLFTDTIGANIRYGRLDATDEEVRRAAITANAETFIERMPEGYDTELAESGGNISNGQRQLLSIARAVLADPKILILDEATSSVDTRTEMHIQEAMLHLMHGRTTLIIAHRLSTIRDADCIIVLDDGKICESGNHEALLAKKGVYYKLYMSQFAGIAT
ncbi:MAG: multidrug ABC transporter ATP-binding protein [Clostridiales bacterium]|nr:MAG: multidrug ABC transporter ATP-binding protein [Clostridiales bacterium]